MAPSASPMTPPGSSTSSAAAASSPSAAAKRSPVLKAKRAQAAASFQSSKTAPSRSAPPSMRSSSPRREKKREAAKARKKQLQEAAAKAAANAAAMRVRASEARVAKEWQEKLERAKDHLSPRWAGSARGADDALIEVEEDAPKPQLYYLYQQQAYASAAMLFGREHAQLLYNTAESAELKLISSVEITARASALHQQAEQLMKSSKSKVDTAGFASGAASRFPNAVLFGARLRAFSTAQGLGVQKLIQQAHEETVAAMRAVKGKNAPPAGDSAQTGPTSLSLPDFRVAIASVGLSTAQDERDGAVEELFRMVRHSKQRQMKTTSLLIPLIGPSSFPSSSSSTNHHGRRLLLLRSSPCAFVTQVSPPHP